MSSIMHAACACDKHKLGRCECYTHNACDVDIAPIGVYKRLVTRDPLYKQIGTVIKARRKTLGLNQQELARSLGISRGSLANVETGRQSILVHQLYKFAAALQVMPFDLLPPPSIENFGIEQTELPLPDNLKAQQKEQIARLFGQVETDQTRARGRRRAKITKR